MGEPGLFLGKKLGFFFGGTLGFLGGNLGFFLRGTWVFFRGQTYFLGGTGLPSPCLPPVPPPLTGLQHPGGSALKSNPQKRDTGRKEGLNPTLKHPNGGSPPGEACPALKALRGRARRRRPAPGGRAAARPLLPPLRAPGTTRPLTCRRSAAAGAGPGPQGCGRRGRRVSRVTAPTGAAIFPPRRRRSGERTAQAPAGPPGIT